MSPEPPETLGRYRVLAPLGQGAMGQVFLAQDPRIDRKVALKIVRVQGDTTADIEGRTRRLLAEARAAGRLLHPNIVTLFDAGDDDDLVYLAFEYVDGCTLAARMKEPPRLSLEEVLRIASEVADGLDHAHKQGIVHRDIKPSNVLLDLENRAKIADFGIAKIAGGDTALTTTGMVIGSPNYMAPEQVKGEPLDGRADVFALGALLYELLTTRRAFDGDTITTLVYQILHEQPIELAACRPDLPPSLSELVRRMLAKERDDRLPAAADASRSLRDIAAALPPATASWPATEPMAAPPGLRSRRTSPRRTPSTESNFESPGTAAASSDRSAPPGRAFKAALASVGLVALVIATAFALRAIGSRGAGGASQETRQGAKVETAPSVSTDGTSLTLLPEPPASSRLEVAEIQLALSSSVSGSEVDSAPSAAPVELAAESARVPQTDVRPQIEGPLFPAEGPVAQRAAKAMARFLELDQQLATSTRLSLRIDPADAQVLLKSPDRPGLVPLGNAVQFGATGSGLLVLPRPGFYVLVLRQAGMKDVRIGLRAESRGSDVTPIQASMQLGESEPITRLPNRRRRPRKPGG